MWTGASVCVGLDSLSDRLKIQSHVEVLWKYNLHVVIDRLVGHCFASIVKTSKWEHNMQIMWHIVII